MEWVGKDTGPERSRCNDLIFLRFKAFGAEFFSFSNFLDFLALYGHRTTGVHFLLIFLSFCCIGGIHLESQGGDLIPRLITVFVLYYTFV